MPTLAINDKNSTVKFALKRFGVDWLTGGFQSFTGMAEMDADNPESSSTKATIYTRTIFSGDEKRDTHLKSPDFFSIEKYPEATFESTEIKKDGDGKLQVTGELTIRDKTNTVVLTVEYQSDAGNVSYSAKTTISRQEFGLNWDTPGGDGASASAPDVEITVTGKNLKYS